MRAVAFDHFGGPDVLRVVELPDRDVGGIDEVLVRVHGAAVNPTDTMRRSGAISEMHGVPGPYVVGMDFAGVVVRLGGGSTRDLAVGDRVMGALLPRGSHGAYSELVSVPASCLMRVPADLDLHAAATIPMNGLTAMAALDAVGLESRETLAVTGAAGVLGSYVIQLAKAQGLRVLADASSSDRRAVLDIGADVVLPRGPGIAELIREQCPSGVDGLVDGAVLDGLVADAVADHGAVATLRHYVGPSDRGLRWKAVRVRHCLNRADMTDRLTMAVAAGTVTHRLAEVVSAEAAAEAHVRMQARGLRGRFVIDFAPAD